MPNKLAIDPYPYLVGWSGFGDTVRIPLSTAGKIFWAILAEDSVTSLLCWMETTSLRTQVKEGSHPYKDGEKQVEGLQQGEECSRTGCER